MRDTLSQKRRRLITAATLWAVTPQVVFAQSSSIYSLFPQLDSFVRPALQQIRFRRFSWAAGALEQAVQIIEENPEERWPWRAYVLPVYGYVLNELGYSHEAVQVLRQALQARDRIFSEKLSRFAQVINGLDNGLGLQLLNVEFKRQILSVVSTSQQIRTVDELLFDRRTGMFDLLFTLAWALHADAKDVELVALYHQYIAPIKPSDAYSPSFVAQEYRLSKVAVLLAQAGKFPEAAEALDVALSMNTRRFPEAAKMGVSMETLWSAFIVRRGIVSAQLDLSNAAGSLGEKSESLLIQMIQSKNGGVRYLETLTQKLNSTTDPTVRRLRDQAYELEDRMVQLPPTTAGVQSLMHLATQQGLSLVQAAQALNTADILNVYETNAFPLQELRRNLGTRAIVGFFLYSPMPNSTVL